MIFRSSKRREDYWITVSDLMAGLMVIFLFLAIAYMIKVQKQYDAFVYLRKEYIEAQEAISKELESEFENDIKIWDAEIDKKTLSIIFLEPDLMFEYDKSIIKPKFKIILKDFFPRYVEALTRTSHTDHIAKIRIEGHSSPEIDKNASLRQGFKYNMDLSQRRASSVLNYVLDTVNGDDYEWIKSHLLGVGYGSTEPKFNYFTNSIDNTLSRRVEFRVVMNAQQFLYDIISGNIPNGFYADKISEKDKDELLQLLKKRKLELRK